MTLNPSNFKFGTKLIVGNLIKNIQIENDGNYIMKIKHAFVFIGFLTLLLAVALMAPLSQAANLIPIN